MAENKLQPEEEKGELVIDLSVETMSLRAMLEGTEDDFQTMNSRFNRLLERLNISKKSMMCPDGRYRIPVEIAPFFQALLIKMSDGYMYELTRNGHLSGTFEEGLEKVRAFREEMEPIVSRMVTPEARETCSIIMRRLANENLYIEALRALERVRRVAEVLGGATNFETTRAWRRFSDLLDQFLEELQSQ